MANQNHNSDVNTPSAADTAQDASSNAHITQPVEPMHSIHNITPSAQPTTTEALPNLLSLQKGLKALVLSLVTALGFGLSSGIVYGLRDVIRQSNSSVFPSTETEHSQVLKQSFTLSDYRRLVLGMSLTEVELILKPGVEESRSDVTARVLWKNKDRSFIRLSFAEDKLINKEQQGLIDSCQ